MTKVFLGDNAGDLTTVGCPLCLGEMGNCHCAFTVGSFEQPELVELFPKKQPVYRLKEAKRKEQLKMWGLRK